MLSDSPAPKSPVLLMSARLSFLVDLILLLMLLLRNSEDDCEIKFILFIKTWKFGGDGCSTIIVDGIKKILY